MESFRMPGRQKPAPGGATLIYRYGVARLCDRHPYQVGAPLGGFRTRSPRQSIPAIHHPFWAIFISAFIARRGRYAILLIRFPLRPILAMGTIVIEPRKDNALVRRAIKRRMANDRGRKRNNLVMAPNRQPSMRPREDCSNRSPLRLRTSPLV